MKSRFKMPNGLSVYDSLNDCIMRADSLSNEIGHSGLLTSNKDLRRIVLLVWEYRKFNEEYQKLFFQNHLFCHFCIFI